MKLLIDIADSQAPEFIEMTKNYSSVKTQSISRHDAELFEEIREIKKALKNVEKIKSGKLKGRPAEELLNEL
jgi:cell fate (sporulation/competence/biofilm development) regulator YlbF (YheA/YmcA/DUF963 family)